MGVGKMGFHSPSEYPNVGLYILDETHITVTVATAIVLIYTRSPHVAWFAAGAVGASQTAKCIKLLLRRPRPPPPPSTSSLPSPIRPKKTYGMPSTHSTALTYYMIYLFPLLSYLPIPSLLPHPLSLPPSITHPFAQICLVGMWAAGLWSRQALGYHTIPQILVGALLGTAVAVFWKGIWEAGRRGGWGVEEVLESGVESIWGLCVKCLLVAGGCLPYIF